MAERLTGTQRAAARLALGVLRQIVIRAGDRRRRRRVAWGSERYHDGLLASSAAMLHDVLWCSTGRIVYVGSPPTRIEAARLALYLRALLRADAVSLGREWPVPSGRRCRNVMHRHDEHGRCAMAACRCWDVTRRITPLWELAPAHGGDCG